MGRTVDDGCVVLMGGSLGQPSSDVHINSPFSSSSLLATTSADGTCKIWSTADFQLRTTLKKNVDKWVWDCAFSCDSQYIFTGERSQKENRGRVSPRSLLLEEELTIIQTFSESLDLELNPQKGKFHHY